MSEVNPITDELSSANTEARLDQDSWFNNTTIPFVTTGILDTAVKETPLPEVLAYLSAHDHKALSDQIKVEAGKFRRACIAADVCYTSSKIFKDQCDMLSPATAESLRSQKKKVNELKKALPYACFSVHMNYRKDDAVTSFTGLTQVDFDHVDAEKVPEYIEKLSNHKSAVAVFVSPSGDGIKVAARIPLVNIADENYKDLYQSYHRKISYVLGEFAGIPQHLIDTSVGDLSRACFIPFDKECKVNPGAEPLDLDNITVNIEEVSGEVEEALRESGAEQDELGVWGGGTGEAQAGYGSRLEFKAMLEQYGNIELGEPDRTKKLPEGGTQYGWYVECPAKHTSGNYSKSMIFFTEGMNIKFPAGFKCFSDDCVDHGWAWFANEKGLPGQSELSQKIFQMNQEQAFVMLGGEGAVIARRFFPEVDRSQNEKEVRWAFPKVKDVELDLKNQFVDVAKQDAKGNWKKVSTPVMNAWMAHKDRRTYRQGVVCDPSGKQYKEVLNIFPGWGITPEEGDWSLMEAHIREVVCGGDEALAEWLLDWCAWPLCNPYVYPNALAEHNMQTTVAPVLRGVEGCGKGTFAQWLLAMYGPSGLHVKKESELLGDFSGHLANKTFIFADEALFAGNPKVVGAMKAMITEDSVLINGKFKNAYSMKVGTNYLLSSNEDWVVSVTEDNRRYCVIDVPPTVVKDQAYFKKLSEQAKNGGVAAMMHALLQRKPSWTDVVAFPETKGTKRQQRQTCTAYDFLHHLGTEGPEFVKLNCAVTRKATIIEDDPYFESAVWPEYIKREELYECYKSYIESSPRKRHREPLQIQAFFEKLEKILGTESFYQKRVKADNEEGRTRLWHIPLPEKLREIIE